MVMKTATYRDKKGNPFMVNYDPGALCIICGLSVIEASYGGTNVCPWCDCGIFRDGIRWTYRESISNDLVRQNAQGHLPQMNGAPFSEIKEQAVTIGAKRGEFLVLSPENLRALRKGAGFTQAGLAERLGLTDRTIQNWEAGNTKPSDLRVIRNLMRVLMPEKFGSSNEAVVTASCVLHIEGAPWLGVAFADDRTPLVITTLPERSG